MFYQLYELNHAALQPARLYADAVRFFYSNPLNPVSHTALGRSVAAAAELFERTTRRYGKPEFGLTKAVVDWKSVDVAERTVWSKPFCNLVRFERQLPAGRKPDPKLLIVAPMS
ncbi:MAG: polyhydroxyalkanoate depolymerase, partial [Mesorhizobium sp.]